MRIDEIDQLIAQIYRLQDDVSRATQTLDKVVGVLKDYAEVVDRLTTLVETMDKQIDRLRGSEP